MDTCTNCGATLRPGAKFCTTCGTRLNEMPVANAGWGTPRSVPDPVDQETAVLPAVQSAPEQSATWNSRDQQAADRWSSAYSAPKSVGADDPAGRFISALDADVKPTPTSPTTTTDPLATWGAPPPSVFAPPPPSTWSYTKTEAEEPVVIEPSPLSTWGVASEEPVDEPEPAAEVEPAAEDPKEDAPIAAEPTEPVDHDTAGFTDDGDDEVDYLSGDENIELSGPVNPVLPADEARDRAIALVDELRRMVRMMSGGEADPGAAAMALTEASLGVGDYSDLRVVLADVQSDPRDIEALAKLAGKVDRISALLEEHSSLAKTIDTAIGSLTS